MKANGIKSKRNITQYRERCIFICFVNKYDDKNVVTVKMRIVIVSHNQVRHIIKTQQ